MSGGERIDLNRFLEDQNKTILKYVMECKSKGGIYLEDKYVKDWVRLYGEKYRSDVLKSGKYDTIE